MPRSGCSFLHGVNPNKKKKKSVVKEVREFAREIYLDLETEFNGEMKNIENARKLKIIAKRKGKNSYEIKPRGCM